MQIVKHNRKLDRLGRITIPIDIRKNMNLNIKDEVEFYYDEENQMFGVKSANKKNQIENKINSLVTLTSEIRPDKFNEVAKLSEEIKRILGIENQLKKEKL